MSSGEKAQQFSIYRVVRAGVWAAFSQRFLLGEYERENDRVLEGAG